MCVVQNVVYAPTMAFNMLSGVMTKNGKRYVFLEDSCLVDINGLVIAEGVIRNGLLSENTLEKTGRHRLIYHCFGY